ncbi:hypothetical protein [Mesorhizobium sp. M0496]|uniref:hypothetical protein n=1 Tax=Mesorhizobium sp. M0496 TaxID=2956952 RepID=UPI0033355EE3
MTARESARRRLACPGFIAISWRNGNPDAPARKSEIDFQKYGGAGSKTVAVFLAGRANARRSKAPRLPRAPCWLFPKQRLPHYCAVQHENARFKAKFFVTFSFALG